MKPQTTLSICIQVSDILADAKRELAVLAKRAKDVEGKLLFSDLTPSSNELNELATAAISASYTLAHAVAQYIGNCIASEADDKSFIALDFTGTRMPSLTPDLQTRMESVVLRYLSASAVGHFLTVIHPSTGAKYPPLWGSSYTNLLPSYLASVVALLTDHEPSRFPKYPYTRHIICHGSYVSLKVGQTETISYVIDADCKDDIICEPEFFGAFHVHKCKWHEFKVTAHRTGDYHLRLYSMHDEEVEFWFTIHVEK